MILSRDLYQARSVIKQIWHKWKWRSLQKPNRLKTIMNWDKLSYGNRFYFYSPRLALDPEVIMPQTSVNLDICPTGALSKTERGVVINKTLCTRCHFCLELEPDLFRSSNDLDQVLKS